MVAQKSTVFALRSSIADLRTKIASLETEQSDLESLLRRLRRRKQSWEIYDQIVAASDRLLILVPKITKLYLSLSTYIDRLRAAEFAERESERAPKPSASAAPKPKPKAKQKPKQSAAAKRLAAEVARAEAQRIAEVAARRERDRQRSAAARAKKKEQQRLEVERLAREESERIAREEAIAEAERQRKQTRAQKEKTRRQKKKIGADFDKTSEQRLDQIYRDRPLTEVQPIKGVTFSQHYAKLPPFESVDWKKVLINVEDNFVDVWGIGKRIRSAKRDTNEKLIAGLKPSALLEILNADVAIGNVHKQLARLPRLVRHLFIDDADAEIAREITAVELRYPDGMKSFAWIFVPDPDKPYSAQILEKVNKETGEVRRFLEIEQPISKIKEAFLPFTATQFLDPMRVSAEVVEMFPDTMAAFLRAGAFGLVRLKGKPFARNLGEGASDVQDSLYSAIVEMQTRYSPAGEMGDQCDPDNPNSRHWKNWMSGIVVFRSKAEKDFAGYITAYNRIMEERKEQRALDNRAYKDYEKQSKKK